MAGTDELLVTDKSPFPPAAPSGHIVANTVQERLRRSLGGSEIVAVHHLDLLTSGLLLLSRNPATRACYQQPFQNQEIIKKYECLTVMPDDWHVGEARDVTLPLDPNPAGHGVRIVEIDVSARAAVRNPKFKLARTTMTFLGPIVVDIGDMLAGSRGDGSGGGMISASAPLHAVGCGCGYCGSSMQVGYWRLQPHTDRTYQLWVTMD